MITIILDKSTFQSLNISETILLHNYYNPNTTHILLREIISDLKKEFKNNLNSSEKVKDYSKKLLPYNTSVNVHYLTLIENELLGQVVNIDYRPLVESEPVETKSGKFGFQTIETPLETALNRWRDGHFSEFEKITSQIWRSLTTKKDNLTKLQLELQALAPMEKKFESLEQLFDSINLLWHNEFSQRDILSFIISEFEVNISNASKIFLDFENSHYKLVQDFAPYSSYCAKVKWFFYQSLRFNLISTKATNILDLHYMFYLPFTQVFSTSDKFQKIFIKFFLTENQTLVSGEELKKDLRFLKEYRDTLSDPGDIKRTLKEPPILFDSLTYQLWKKYIPKWPMNFTKNFKFNKKEIDTELDELVKTKFPSEKNFDFENDTDFIVKKRVMKLTDFCPCGSGKILKECCFRNYNPNED